MNILISQNSGTVDYDICISYQARYRVTTSGKHLCKLKTRIWKSTTFESVEMEVSKNLLCDFKSSADFIKIWSTLHWLLALVPIKSSYQCASRILNLNSQKNSVARLSDCGRMGSIIKIPKNRPNGTLSVISGLTRKLILKHLMSMPFNWIKSCTRK